MRPILVGGAGLQSSAKVSSGHACHLTYERSVGQQTPRDLGVLCSIDVTPAVVGIPLDIAFPTSAGLNLMDLYLRWPEAREGM
ncbi:hypothetical protein DEVEQU_00053 [Devosia equisanguinis]|uniref:Uncharacterized protein n=1 Tax=Devosia equisanguinis TaxID=2490941 RepID=A0A3S4D2Q1_9HYPH|nr:hypothetical protein DEVEQU_00053 [Devosia equisanguinis]